MKNFGLSCVAILLIGCAAGTVIQTPGTHSLPDAEVAQFDVPYALTLLTVDGGEVAAVRSRNRYQVRLLPGMRRLRFAYEKDWGNQDTYDWVYSAHVVEVELTVHPGSLYRVGYPVPGNRGEARKLAADLQVWVDGPGDSHAVSRSVATYGSPLTRLIQGDNAGRAVTAAAPEPSSATEGSVGQAEALLTEQDALERLKLWWKLASVEQREAFQAWVSNQ